MEEVIRKGDARLRGEIDIATPQGHALRTLASTEVHPLPLFCTESCSENSLTFLCIFIHPFKKKIEKSNCSYYRRIAIFRKEVTYRLKNIDGVHRK